jgi:hypothetical protein
MHSLASIYTLEHHCFCCGEILQLNILKNEKNEKNQEIFVIFRDFFINFQNENN